MKLAPFTKPLKKKMDLQTVLPNLMASQTDLIFNSFWFLLWHSHICWKKDFSKEYIPAHPSRQSCRRESHSLRGIQSYPVGRSAPPIRHPHTQPPLLAETLSLQAEWTWHWHSGTYITISVTSKWNVGHRNPFVCLISTIGPVDSRFAMAMTCSSCNAPSSHKFRNAVPHEVTCALENQAREL